jgi:outer membrane protein assembly factor BamB
VETTITQLGRKEQDCQLETTSFIQHYHLEYATGVSATPVTYSKEHTVYFPTWGGFFIALDYITCKEKWRLNVATIVNDFHPAAATTLVIERFPGSRTSPQVDGDVIYFGTQKWALLLAMERKTGKFLKSVQINTHPWAIVTASPTFYRGDIFVGAAGLEVAAAGLVPNYTCCSFVGNLVSVRFDKSTHKFSTNCNISIITKEISGLGNGLEVQFGEDNRPLTRSESV